MLKIIISGCNGYMGRTVARIAESDGEIEIAAGFDIKPEKTGTFPVYVDPMEFGGHADAIIDFSNPVALDNLLDYAVLKKIPLILCTTGYDDAQLDRIQKTAEKVPLFRSGNMSVGINLMMELIRKSCAFLGKGYDVEIVERHHKRKLDAPSGTAIMLADAANDSLPYDAEYVYERQSVRKPRADNEIGISSLRGGTIVGDHSIVFAGLDEVIEIKHSAYSRDVFAAGAVKAAKFMATVTSPGLYDMQDVLKD